MKSPFLNGKDVFFLTPLSGGFPGFPDFPPVSGRVLRRSTPSSPQPTAAPKLLSLDHRRCWGFHQKTPAGWLKNMENPNLKWMI